MKHVAVIGLGQFGHQIAVNLTQQGYDVIAVDKDAEVVTEIKDLVTQAVILDSQDEKSMRAVNLDHVDIAVVAIGSNVQASLLTAALLQRMEINEIFVRAIEPLQESILNSMGIQHVINIEKDMGLQISNTIVSETGRYIEISNRHALIEVVVPKILVGKSLKLLTIRESYKVNIVGIKTNAPVVASDGEITFQLNMTDVPDPRYVLKKDDVLVIAGTDENLNKFIHMEDQKEV